MAPLVQTTDGLIKGSKRTNFNGEEFHTFLCIPYGKAPVGNLRFKAPQPVEPWEGIRDATQEQNTCFQKNLFLQQYTGTEDCLSLHVFTKKLPEEERKLKPVMVFVHGGGFIMGTHETDLYGPDFLMTEDIILVYITYRVGLLGFLSLNDLSLEIPGNAGLKDQILALKWVQNNIQFFNGDTNNVTIFGESAGSASVEYLLLSKSAKNLFHKAIMQSGSTLNHWASGYFNAADFAKHLGKPNISEGEILKLLTDMPVRELYDAQMKYIKMNKIPADFGLVGPVIEKPNPSAFLTEKPIDLLHSGDYNMVPVIIGYNDAEGLLFDFFSMLKTIDRKVGEDIPLENMLPLEVLKHDRLLKRTVEAIKKFYCTGNDPNKKVQLLTDAFFVAGIISSARNQGKVSKSPVYFYRFSLETGLNFLKRFSQLDFPGACHGDELGYLFSTALSDDIAEFEKTAVKRMVTLWTNFAKFGNPTPKGNDLNIEWKPIERDQLNFLDIGKDLKMDANPEADRMNVWKEIYQISPVSSKF